MNLYNKLYFIEYVKSPFLNTYGYKQWYLNLSKKKYNYKHRIFNLPSVINKYLKFFHRFHIIKNVVGEHIIYIGKIVSESYYKHKKIFKLLCIRKKYFWEFWRQKNVLIYNHFSLIRPNKIILYIISIHYMSIIDIQPMINCNDIVAFHSLIQRHFINGV